MFKSQFSRYKMKKCNYYPSTTKGDISNYRWISLENFLKEIEIFIKLRSGLALREVLEQAVETYRKICSHKPLTLIFVDFNKAYTVEFLAVLKALQQGRVRYRYAKLIKRIYKNAKQKLLNP